MSSFEIVEERQLTSVERFGSEGISSDDFKFLPKTGQTDQLGESFSSEYIESDRNYIPFDHKYLSKYSSKLSQKIYRTHYTKEIMESIEWLSKNHVKNEPLSFNCMAVLLSNIKDFMKDSPRDPFCGFLLAMYDGLSYNDAWIQLEQKSFNQIGKYLKDLTNQELTFKKVDKYISKLESLGLNVLPY